MRLSRRQPVTPNREDQILAAALELFFTRGYHACSLRDLAGVLEMNVATLYHYFESKDQILFRLQHDGMAILVERATAALAAVPAGDHAGRMRALCRAHFTYHTEHTWSARLHVAEFRSLEPASREVIRDQMKAYERIFIDVVAAGVKAGVFAPNATKITAFTVMGAGAHISNWYHADGPLSAAAIVDEAVEFVMDGLLARRRRTRTTPTEPA
ncbi:MAG: TetR family transcriptional regulator [Dehalococcoidia bacterium]|nr:TetR family transcriptional regulator [Dehalococcoidia bacterium]